LHEEMYTRICEENGPPILRTALSRRWRTCSLNTGEDPDRAERWALVAADNLHTCGITRQRSVRFGRSCPIAWFSPCHRQNGVTSRKLSVHVEAEGLKTLLLRAGALQTGSYEVGWALSCILDFRDDPQYRPTGLPQAGDIALGRLTSP
jgi:hypothetical protein